MVEDFGELICLPLIRFIRRCLLVFILRRSTGVLVQSCTEFQVSRARFRVIILYQSLFADLVAEACDVLV